jgi:membrane-associated phospholipid phosphatase
MEPVEADRSRPFAWPAVLACAAAFSVLTILVWHRSSPMAWERPIIRTFEHRPIPGRDLLIKMFEPTSFVLLALALTLAALAAGRRRLAVSGLAGCATAAILAQLVLKPLVDRTSTRIVGVHHRLVRVSRPMFPSSHVTAAASLALFAWMILGRRTRLIPLLALIPLVVGHAVISRQMHYPADVLGGLLLGPTIVYCVVEGCARMNRRAPVSAPDVTIPAGTGVGGRDAMVA